MSEFDRQDYESLARQDGRDAARDNISINSNPYVSSDMREAWEEGFKEVQQSQQEQQP